MCLVHIPGLLRVVQYCLYSVFGANTAFTVCGIVLVLYSISVV